MRSRKFTVMLAMTIAAGAAELPLPELRIEPKGGGSILYIRNVAAQPLTAFLIELVNYPGSYFAFWQDDAAAEPISPGAEKRIEITNMTVGAVPDYVKMRAALYADGSSAGIAQKIEQLIARRRSTLDTTRQLIARLEKARSAGTTNDARISDLKAWADSLEPSGKGRRDSQQEVNQAAARSLITAAISELQKHSLDDELSSLHSAEQKLATSRPPLEQ